MKQTLVTHHLAARTLFVLKEILLEHVHVPQDTLGIRISDVDRNVSQIMTAPQIKHVRIINA